MKQIVSTPRFTGFFRIPAIIFGTLLILLSVSSFGCGDGITTDNGTASSSSSYTIPIADDAPPLYIVAFCPTYDNSMADNGGVWADIMVNDPASLSSWVLKSGNDSYINTQMSSGDISSWTLQQGEIIRYHGKNYSGSTDLTKSDNNTDRWDFKSSSTYGINQGHGIIWIENGSGDIIDFVSYETSRNTDEAWLESANHNPLAVLTTADSEGHWSGTAEGDGFYWDNTSSYIARLKDHTTDGDAAGDWEQATEAWDEFSEESSSSSSSTSSSSSSSTATGSVDTDFGDLGDPFTPSSSDPQYTYYSAADGDSGTTLMNSLHNIIDGHTDRGYSSLYDIYKNSDITSDGKVWDMYSANDWTGLDRPYTYEYDRDEGGSASGEGEGINREHVIPQSKFDSHSPMKSDAHFVIPSDIYVNNRRGSYPHADVSSATWTSDNDSKLGSCANAGYSGTVFEPNVDYKGDIARMYFYFCIRYRGRSDCEAWESMAAGAKLLGWSQTVYKQWHNDDPVSDKEVARNNAIAASSAQGNRNPFIDYPGLVEIIDFTQ